MGLWEKKKCFLTADTAYVHFVGASVITNQATHIFLPESVTAVCFPGASTKRMRIRIAFIVASYLANIDVD